MGTLVFSTPRLKNGFKSYGLAVALFLCALVGTLLLQPAQLFSPLFFLAVLMSAWIGGTGPGVVAAVLSTLAIDYFFLGPSYAFGFDLAQGVRLLSFFVSALVVSWWSSLRRRAENALRQARGELETKVNERTAELTAANARLEAEVVERRRAEEAQRKTAAELARVNRTATLGVFGASIAHEVNQPLGAMVTSAAACSRWLAARPPDIDKAQRALERIGKDGRRASEVIDRIRMLVQRQAPRCDPVDVNEAIREVIALTRDETRRHDISLDTSLAQDLPPVAGDRVQIQQVILNLIVNAIEAMSAVDDRRRELTIGSSMESSNAVRVEVRDSGPGVDPEHAERLFEAFYTSKADGIGMGLSISRSIVEAHGGRLWATPNQPQGAVFRFSLPLEGTVST
jgi:C4-dicarboxylate-specific signal transduction histidine kinase